jgi:hypothetical protein
MNTERKSWADVTRAAERLAVAWEMAGGPMPRGPVLHYPGAAIPLPEPESATLTTSPGKPSAGMAGGLYWSPCAPRHPLPGGQNLPPSARDAYDTVTARSDALFSLAAERRNKHRELAALGKWWTEAHALDMPREAVALVGDLVNALTEGWPE